MLLISVSKLGTLILALKDRVPMTIILKIDRLLFSLKRRLIEKKKMYVKRSEAFFIIGSKENSLLKMCSEKFDNGDKGYNLVQF